MKYMYIISIRNPVKGNHTLTDIITANPGDTRATLFLLAYTKACQQLGVDPASNTGVEFFYLEPLELP